MPKVTLNKAHALSMEEARGRVAELVDNFMERYGRHVKDVSWSDDKNAARAKGRGFDAQFKLTEDEVRVAVDLSFLLSPLKGRIEDSVHRTLNEAFDS